MSALPFFQSAGWGDLLFGEGVQKTNSIWETHDPIRVRTRRGKLAGRGKHDARLGRMVQVKKRGGGNPLIWAQRERNLLQLWWNEIERGEEPKERKQKEGTLWADNTIQVMVEARQHQNGNEWGSHFMLGSQRSHYHGKKIQALLTAARASGGKDECQVRLTGIERDNWTGTEMGRLGGYGFRGTVTAGVDLTRKGGKWEQVMWTCEEKEKAAERKRKRQQSKSVCKQEKLENMWLPGYNWCVSLELRSHGQPRRGWSHGTHKNTQGVWSCKLPFWQSPAAAVGIVACTHVLFDQTTSPIGFRPLLQGTKKVQKKRLDICHEAGWYVFE